MTLITRIAVFISLSTIALFCYIFFQGFWISNFHHLWFLLLYVYPMRFSLCSLIQMPRVHNPKPRPHIMSLSFPLKPFLGSWVLLVGLDLTLGFRLGIWAMVVAALSLRLLSANPVLPRKAVGAGEPPTHTSSLQDKLTWYNICFILYNVLLDFLF